MELIEQLRKMADGLVGSYRCLNPDCPSNQPRGPHAAGLITDNPEEGTPNG